MEYIEHWGIPDMHWGLRRFQNKDGSLTEEGRKRYGVGPKRNDSAKKLKAFSKNRAKAQPRSASKAPVEEPKLTKEEAIRSGDAATILKYAKDMSSNDLQEALNRINKINDLKKIRLDEETKKQPKIKKMINAGKKEAADVLGKIAKEQATNLAKAGATLLGKSIIDATLTGKDDKTKAARNALLKAVGAETDNEREKKERNKIVENLIKSGDADKIYAQRAKLTTEELKTALNRISNTNAIRKFTEEERRKNQG